MPGCAPPGLTGPHHWTVQAGAGCLCANFDTEKAPAVFYVPRQFWYATHDATGYTRITQKYGYPNKQRGVWVEGSAGVALLARRLGEDAIATDILARLAPLRYTLWLYRLM